MTRTTEEQLEKVRAKKWITLDRWELETVERLALAEKRSVASQLGVLVKEALEARERGKQ
jgi:hypothetical protein